MPFFEKMITPGGSGVPKEPNDKTRRKRMFEQYKLEILFIIAMILLAMATAMWIILDPGLVQRAFDFLKNL